MEQKIRRDRNMGDNLRKLRLDHDISQEKLCAELQRRGCDIGRSTYAKYEAGELNIRASVIIELKKIYNCSYDDFFEGLDVITLNLGNVVFDTTTGQYYTPNTNSIVDMHSTGEGGGTDEGGS